MRHAQRATKYSAIDFGHEDYQDGFFEHEWEWKHHAKRFARSVETLSMQCLYVLSPKRGSSEESADNNEMKCAKIFHLWFISLRA